MSLVTVEALVQLFEDDPVLIDLLAVDSHRNSGGRPAIYGMARGNNPKDLPQLIVRQPGGRPDPDQRLSSAVRRERFNIEAWAKTTSDVHNEIIERVIFLLHEKRLELPSGNLKLLHEVGEERDNYDGELEENFSVAIFELIYAP